MFKTTVGPVESEENATLRPETAQGIFANFANVQQAMRRKLPFGIAQIGKAFRNEITPDFTFTREFEQMEIEYFASRRNTSSPARRTTSNCTRNGSNSGSTGTWPGDRARAVAETRADARRAGPLRQGDRRHRIPVPELSASELEGIANRQDYDLTAHSKDAGRRPRRLKLQKNADSTTKLDYFDDQPRLAGDRQEGRAIHPLRDRTLGGRDARDAGSSAKPTTKSLSANRK